MKEIKINVSEGKQIKEQNDLFGIFFEDLNHAADGGLYGEWCGTALLSSIQ